MTEFTKSYLELRIKELEADLEEWKLKYRNSYDIRKPVDLVTDPYQDITCPSCNTRIHLKQGGSRLH